MIWCIYIYVYCYIIYRIYIFVRWYGLYKMHANVCILSILYISLNSWNSIVYHCFYMHTDIDSIVGIVDTYKYAYYTHTFIYIQIHLSKHLILLLYSHVFLYCTWCCYGWRDGTAPAPHQAKHLDMELFQRLLKQAVFNTGFHGFWGLKLVSFFIFSVLKLVTTPSISVSVDIRWHK